MPILTKIKRIYSKFENVLMMILKMLTNKKTLLFTLGVLLFFQIKNSPVQINTSDFVKELNRPHSNIGSLINLDNTVQFFKIGKQNFFTSYYVQDVSSFNNNLV